jgi:hypothetical protein
MSRSEDKQPNFTVKHEGKLSKSTVRREVIVLNEKKNVLRYQMGNQNAVNRRRTDITMTKRKRTKGQTMIYKTVQKLKILHYEPQYKLRGVGVVNSDVSEGLVVPVPQVASVQMCS